MWITNSKEANFFLVLANVDLSKGYKGITCFIVTKDMGVEIAKKEQKLGIRASSTCTLNFDDVKVPLENVLGGEAGIGKGYKVRIIVRANENIMLTLTRTQTDRHRNSKRR
jgi:short/branched chain acyl-CoA dehydrogenase